MHSIVKGFRPGMRHSHKDAFILKFQITNHKSQTNPKKINKKTKTKTKKEKAWFQKYVQWFLFVICLL